MTATRLVLAVLGTVALGPLSSATFGKSPPVRKPVMEPARVRLLAEIIRTDPDEKKQRAAVAELAEADPRVHPEVVPALVAALKKEAAAVRATAAEVIGRFKTTYSAAGAALEASAESDPSPAVRDAARQALWHYHLNGYRSAKGADAFPAQTVEPPIAKPARPRNPITAEPPVVRTAAAVPFPRVPEAAPLPPVGLPPGPRVALLPGFFGPRTVLSGSFHSNLTVEPPVAKRPENWFPPPTTPDEPPIRPRWPQPVTVGKPPPFVRDLPPVVSDPGPIPGMIPFPEPTAEPPLGKR